VDELRFDGTVDSGDGGQVEGSDGPTRWLLAFARAREGDRRRRGVGLAGSGIIARAGHRGSLRKSRSTGAERRVTGRSAPKRTAARIHRRGRDSNGSGDRFVVVKQTPASVTSILLTSFVPRTSSAA